MHGLHVMQCHAMSCMVPFVPSLIAKGPGLDHLKGGREGGGVALPGRTRRVVPPKRPPQGLSLGGVFSLP